MIQTALLLSLVACSGVPVTGVELSTETALAGVRTPSEHLGRPLGGDFTLADWKEVSGYFWHLDGQSDRVQTSKVGTTTEGRDFLLSVISSEKNLAQLEDLKHYATILADPRGRTDVELAEAVEHGKVFLFVSCAMHATECAGTQFGMAFAHELATSDQQPWKSARENCVVMMIPSMNPDGLDHVTQWYRETVGTPYEATGLLKLYQHYAGHDNNRDWFMLTQNETRITSELLYKTWHPQVYWDVHQQGSRRERFFVPPFRDPLNPNLEPTIISGIDALGSRALHDLTSTGFSGVSTGVSYDMWWNGGNRNVPVRHNIIGLLTEAASADLASPIFLPISKLLAPRGLGDYVPSNRFPKPWPGGWWRIKNIIDYELAFGRSLLGSLSREPQLWLENSLNASKRAIEENGKQAPRSWILPSDNRDPSAVKRLVDVLIRTGVEIHVAQETIRVDGREWPKGSIVILRDQPYGGHVKDLFEVQRYPKGDPPYDVAGWTLPFLLGVARVETMALPEVELVRAETVQAAVEAFAGDPRLADADESQGALSTHDSSSWGAIYGRLAAGRSAHLETEDPGTLGLLTEAPAEQANIKALPRIGLYTPWSGSMDEGWMRYVLDTQDVPYVRVRNEMLRAGQLGDFLDALIIPSISPGQLDRGRAPGSVHPEYTRGIEAEGAVAIEEFVRAGGTLVTLGSSSRYAIDLFELPLVDVTRGSDADGFSCPGSVLRTVPQPSPFTAGLPASLAVFFSRSSAWRDMTEKELEDSARTADETIQVPLRYAASRLLMSGWIEAPERIENEAAWIVAQHGEGRVHLFGFRPQYRGWAQGTFGLVHRAILLNAIK